MTTPAPFTASTQRVVDLAARLGLRPDVKPAYQGAVRVMLNGHGPDAGFGAIVVGARTGKILRMSLRHGNVDHRPAARVTHRGYRGALRELQNYRDLYELHG